MTTDFADRAAAAIGAAKTADEVVRSEGRLAFLCYELPPNEGMTFCRGKLDYSVYGLQTRGADTICRLKVAHDGETLTAAKVNLDAPRSRRQLANDIAAALPVADPREIERDLMLLSDMARAKLGELISGAESKAPTYVMTAEDEAAALRLLRSPLLLQQLDDIITRINVIGEHRNRMLIYLALTSRLLDAPVNVLIKGDSSAGKSFVSQSILENLFPRECYKTLTMMTPQSLYYYKDLDAFQHKILAIFEQPGAERADYAIRSLQSERRLSIAVTVRDPRSGEFETKERIIDGPVMFLVTTTLVNVNYENETRNLALFADETPDQTRRIIDAYAERMRLRPPSVPGDELRLWQNAQRLLKPLRVKIPFASTIAKHFPIWTQRVRRDFPRFIALLETLALLHQYQRTTSSDEVGEYIEASVKDYALARFISETAFQRTLTNLGPRSVLILDYCADRRYDEDRPASEAMLGEKPLREFTYADIGAGLRWTQPTTKKWMRPLIDHGYLAAADDASPLGQRGRGRRNRFVMASIPDGLRVLAEIADIAPELHWTPPEAWLKWPRSDDGAIPEPENDITV